MRTIFADKCVDYQAELVEFDSEVEYVHLLINYPPQAQVSKVINSLKGVSSLGLATATGLSKIVDNDVSHDQVTRMLSNSDFDSKALWHNVKSLVRQHEHIDGCLIL